MSHKRDNITNEKNATDKEQAKSLLKANCTCNPFCMFFYL